MAKKKKTLDDIFNDDLDGLLDSKPTTSNVQSEEERLIASFEEINDFYKKNKRAPQEGSISETSLFYRLNGFNERPDKIKILKKYDVHGLLGEVKEAKYIDSQQPSIAAEAPQPIAEDKIAKAKKLAKEQKKRIEKLEKETEQTPINSIEDILNNDVLGILETGGESIFTLKHVPQPNEKTMPDYIASREPCMDFEKFEPIFLECQNDLREKKRKIMPFSKEQQIGKGNFFVLKGVLCFVAQVGKRERVNGKINARLRLIFENGTESDMLLRSLAVQLYKDGRRVTEHEEKLLDNFKNITGKDRATGFIYVLQSKSKDPQIAGIRNLFKIGYSSTYVEERIKNAEKEPTYLMADVHLVSTYRTYNFQPEKLEKLLHRFFGTACLDINLYDADGQMYRPREWFVAPFEVIEQAIEFMLSGEIVEFRYDVERGEIVGR